MSTTQTLTLCLKPRQHPQVQQAQQARQQPLLQAQHNGRARRWTKPRALSNEERDYLKKTVGFEDVDEIPESMFDMIMQHARSATNAAEAALMKAARFTPAELDKFKEAINSDKSEDSVEVVLNNIILASKRRVNTLKNTLKNAIDASADAVNKRTEAMATNGKLQQLAAEGKLKTTTTSAPSMRLGALGRSLAPPPVPQGHRLGGEAANSSLV
jgi:hypothetical protein